MTIAWYGHLRFKSSSIWLAIGMSWLLALPKYALQVPANRMGYGDLSTYQLKILQECITLVVFIVFAWLTFGETPNLRHLISFGLIFLAAVATFYK